jgi:hypothetical protein
VQEQKHLHVDWRFISLKLLNEERGYGAYASEVQERIAKSHGLGLRLLTIASAVRERHGREPLAELYTRLGRRIHVEKDAPSLRSDDGVRAILDDLGLDAGLVSEALADDRVADVRADTEVALDRCGRDVGTPILTFAPPDGPSFFGPVINRIPRGADAVELWEATERIARFPGFAELKRSMRGTPEVE